MNLLLLLVIIDLTVKAYCPFGKLGEDCSQNCSTNCRLLSKGILHCNQSTGVCSEGCVPGFYTPTCNKTCIENCQQKPCDLYEGTCLLSCENNWCAECPFGKFGEDCKRNCSTNCLLLPNGSLHCHNTTGVCSEGCVPGFYTPTCDATCSETCPKKLCHLYEGSCLLNCEDNRCGSNCNSECDTNTTTSGTGGNITVGVIVGVILAVSTVFLAVSFIVLFFYRKYVCLRVTLRHRRY